MQNDKKHYLVIDYLSKLGFEKVEARLYEVLVCKGPLTILEASRAARIERTALYRMIEDLTERGLIEEVLEHKSRRVRAVPPERVRQMVEQQKQVAKDLEEGFDQFEQVLGKMPELTNTQVRYYRGIAGIKQIMWNETRAQDEVLGYTYRNMEEIAGVKFFKKWVNEIERRGIIIIDLRSDQFLASTDKPGFERVHIQESAWRYLPDSVMQLSHNLDIYNNVVAIYYWENNDVFGVEIENQKIAETQRSIWKTLWKLAESQTLPPNYKHLAKKLNS